MGSDYFFIYRFQLSESVPPKRCWLSAAGHAHSSADADANAKRMRMRMRMRMLLLLPGDSPTHYTIMRFYSKMKL